MFDFVLQGMAILIVFPLLALIPIAAFLLLFIRSRSWFVLGTTVLWSLYLPYELAMKHRILCTGECNIRIDLLVIYPVLIVMSAAGVVMAVLASRRRASS